MLTSCEMREPNAFIRFSLLFLSLMTAGCASQRMTFDMQNRTSSTVQPAEITSVTHPPVIVYKMKGDYAKLVPVQMDEKRERIISYPAPSDLYTAGDLALPLPLDDNYWLDRRGIGTASVFLDYTYEEYAAFTKVPALDTLSAHIAEKYPFVEMYQVPYVPSAETDYYNQIVKSGFVGCEKLNIRISE